MTHETVMVFSTEDIEDAGPLHADLNPRPSLVVVTSPVAVGTTSAVEDQSISKRPYVSPSGSPPAAKRTRHSSPSPDCWRELLDAV